MFKQIPYGNGHYYINEYGVVINLASKHIISQCLDKRGYPIVSLYIEGKRVRFYVHRLVAIVFLPNPNNLPVVRHLDNNPLNSHVSNLKWGTQQENVQQAYDDGIGGGAKKFKYQLSHPTSPVLIEKLGMQCISDIVGINRGILYHLCHQHRPIKNGQYTGWYIDRIDDN